MARFFIDRPVFAWVIALFISVVGAIAITQLPVAYYPPVAPPAISVTATYPGASPQLVEQAVISVIENELNGVDRLLYMESTSDANGRGQITLTFEPGTDPALAQVDVQNKLTRATPRLPQVVNQQGIVVDKTNNNLLLVVTLKSANPAFDATALGDYASRYVMPEIQRINGVGSINLFGTEKAMRIWLNTSKLISLNLSPAQVNAAIAAQNAQVSAGTLGALPNVNAQAIAATVVVKGQLADVEAFGNIILRANPDGTTVRLKDVARIELGAQNYSLNARNDGKPIVGLGIMPAPGSNAVSTVADVRATMAELSQYFPEGVSFDVPVDSSTFITLSIEKVVHTLFEAIALVFVVMLLFLQNFRYTLIPTLVVPVALLGTFAVLLGLGFSINVLTLFAMVLVIGILVDDAIVVVENVERIMSEERLGPREATVKAMGQITGAIIGITVVLVSVFLPMLFFSGSVGNIYRQFATTMAVSILFSAFLALSLTPALCATLLKPVAPTHGESRWFGWFNRLFARGTKNYDSAVQRVVRRSGRYLVVYAVLIVAVVLIAARLPTSFLPDEDQGRFYVMLQLPAGATAERSRAVVQEMEQFFMAQEEIDTVVSVVGFNFFGNGQNMASAFVMLKPWSERRGEQHSAAALVARTQQGLSHIREANIFVLNPPSIPELGNGSGYSLRLQDRGNIGYGALNAAAAKLQQLAAAEPAIGEMHLEGIGDASQLEIVIDRDKAYASGIDFAEVDSTLSTLLGSRYINDFPNDGRMQRVIVQSDAPFRMQPQQLLDIEVPNSRGDLVPLSSIARTRWQSGPLLLVHYDGYPAIRLSGVAAPGYSTGDAMAAIDRLAAQLPGEVGLEWHGISREERLASGQMAILLGLSLLAVFLCLAALYESWAIPVAVLLVVPLGVLGSVLAAWVAGLDNDVYFKVGLIAIIGLSAKNAILIIEFAQSLRAEGMALVEATVTACRQRFRPILMTSLAFSMGVLPLVFASGAGAASQRAVGTGVLGGMLAATVLAIFLVPVFYLVINRGMARVMQWRGS